LLRWWDEPVFGVFVSLNFPPVVVEEEVMVSAEQDAVGEICFAVVSFPEDDVVGFGVARVWRTVIG
jgi:hypothetical protein